MRSHPAKLIRQTGDSEELYQGSEWDVLRGGRQLLARALVPLSSQSVNAETDSGFEK